MIKKPSKVVHLPASGVMYLTILSKSFAVFVFASGVVWSSLSYRNRDVRYEKFPSYGIYSCSNTGSIRDDPYWTSKANSLELIELSSLNIVASVLVQISPFRKTAWNKKRYDSYWTSRENSLKLVELSNVNIV